MKNKLLILVALFTVQFSFGQNKKADLALIPEPVSMVRQSGEFSLPKTVVITTSTNQPEVLQVANMLQKKLTTATGYTITKKQAANNSANAIHLSLNKPSDKTLGDEGYILNVTTNGITISANQPAGLFYGVQSLYQLLPPEIESKTVVANQKWTVPAVKVTDYPRFKWRGLMFDVSR
ncbi:MAG TPA: glycoside hydrolase family 20 zincin-like fold domain-containing protein, partial [Chitinophagaceae bacterium]